MTALRYLVALPAGILTWIIVGSIPNMLGNYGGLAALFVLLIGPAAGFFAGIGVVTHFEDLAAAEEKRKREAELRDAEALKQQEEVKRQLGVIRQLSSEAQSAALSLPTVLCAAEMDLDRADGEFAEGLYSPFWEAMEDATAKLNSFDQNLHLIASRKALHNQQSESLGTLAPSFSLGGTTLPDPAPTFDRLRAMYRRAQKDSQFANIYEQRRIAAMVDQTNAILLAGFRTLGDAVLRLGDRIADSIQDLSGMLDVRLESLQSSLENAAVTAAGQRDALLAELRESREVEESVLCQLRQDADKRSEHEREARIMLDNIQRRRKPFMGKKY